MLNPTHPDKNYEDQKIRNSKLGYSNWSNDPGN